MGKLEYEVKTEIFQGDSCDHHKLGVKFKYPDDIGELCPWLMDSVNTMVRVMQFCVYCRGNTKVRGMKN